MSKIGFGELYRVSRVIAGGQLLRYAKGDAGYTKRFETAFAKTMGVDNVLTVNSGTNALIAALAAAGIGPGDEVLVPAYTWVATAIAPMAVGAVPVLVNIDESLTMDPEDILRKLTPQTKAIIPVHMLNLVCNMDRVMEIAREHNLTVIEDACQATGAIYKGRRVGSIGHINAVSFNHYKNITSGEGGAVLTNDKRLFLRAQMYHDPGHFIRGHEKSDEPLFSCMNMRVSEVTGALLDAQLTRLDPLLSRLKRRRAVMASAFDGAKGVRLSPHHDPENAVGLAVIFDGEADAQAFGQMRGFERLIETDRHVFTNWEVIRSKRWFDPRMNPHQWAKRDIEYRVEDYARTLDILRRTCRVPLGANYPLPVMQLHRRKVAKALRRPVDYLDKSLA
jgi:dTDP-4-amino-4,6-dideoxygalactose transaminase